MKALQLVFALIICELIAAVFLYASDIAISMNLGADVPIGLGLLSIGLVMAVLVPIALFGLILSR